MTDPLAGMRQALNDGTCDVLMLPDKGKGAPVAVGELFELRSCAVEITATRRVRQKGAWYWRCHFTRYRRTRRSDVHLLGRSGDYAHDERGAIRARDPVGSETTLDTDPGLVERNDGRHPPEPEAVDPAEVRELATSAAARLAYERERRELSERERDRSLTAKLREARVLARRAGIETSTEVEQIAEATESIHRRALEAGKKKKAA